MRSLEFPSSDLMDAGLILSIQHMASVLSPQRGFVSKILEVARYLRRRAVVKQESTSADSSSQALPVLAPRPTTRLIDCRIDYSHYDVDRERASPFVPFVLRPMSASRVCRDL